MEKSVWPVKIYVDDSGKETPLEALAPEDQAAVKNLNQNWLNMVDEWTSRPPEPWDHFDFKCGDIVAASSPDRSKVILFVSWGSEEADLAHAQRAGIASPEFGWPEHWFRRHAPSGVLVVRDSEAGIEPPDLPED